MTTANDTLRSAQRPAEGPGPFERADARVAPAHIRSARLGRAFNPPGKVERFVTVGDCFEVEYAGPVIRIWHVTCLNHDLLPDDDGATVAARKAAHRCGERISPWERGENRVRA